MPTPAETLRAACDALSLTMATVFVPFSQSRNAKPADGAKEPWRSLNWRVTISRNGKDFLTTDYSQGEGNCPASNAAKWKGNRHLQRRAIDIEIETGFAAIAETWSQGEPRQGHTEKHRIAPPSIDAVVYALASDADVIDYGTFEQWADEMGYDTDSRSAEATYRACLEIALKLRAAIGEAGIDALRAASEDY